MISSDWHNNTTFALYSTTARISKKSKWKGRLLALPLGIGTLITIPLARLSDFIHAAVTFRGRALFHALIGLVISPLSAFIAGIAVSCAVLWDPVRACSKFARECLKPPTGRAPQKTLGRWERERLEMSAEIYREAIASDPKQPLPYRRLAQTLIEMGDNKSALEVLRRAKKAFPQDPNLKAAVQLLRHEDIKGLARMLRGQG